MMTLNVNDEVSRLRSVVLGRADSNGPVPKLEDTYDPKSAEHIKAGTYPLDADMVKEMDAVMAVFKKYEVIVHRPKSIENYNQIFSRDTAFVIEDKLIIANILPDREKEIEALEYVWSMLTKDKIIRLPKEVHAEGGDVMPCGDYIFIGTYRGEDYADFITARTNMEAVAYLQKLFPHKKVKSFNLRKSNTVAKDNALHLDCCFQPVGNNLALICESGFKNKADFEMLVSRFGKENCLFLSAEEMYGMNSNIFSLAPNVVVSQNEFTKVNQFFTDHGLTVEGVAYKEVSKMGGLLRCSTLPLSRL